MEYTNSDLHRIASAKSHREAYPSQYSHPLVGKRVAVYANSARPKYINAIGTVHRVMITSWGQMVQLDHQRDDNVYWLAAHCKSL